MTEAGDRSALKLFGLNTGYREAPCSSRVNPFLLSDSHPPPPHQKSGKRQTHRKQLLHIHYSRG